MNQANPIPNNSPYQPDNSSNINTPNTPVPNSTYGVPQGGMNTASQQGLTSIPTAAASAGGATVDSNTAFNGIAHETQPEVVEKETVIVKERKVGGGGCTSFSMRSCCCWGCALLFIAFALIIGFLYMVFFSDVKFFTNMRDQVSDRVDSIFTGDIPEYNNVSVSKYKNDIQDLDIENNTDLTLTMSADEFNTLINQNIGSALNTDNTKDIESLTAIAKFKENQAEVYVKVDKPALPTFIILFENDTTGKVTINSAKVFGLNIDGTQLQDSLRDQAGDTISPNFIFESLVLGDKTDQFEAKEVYFSEDEIRIKFGVRGE